LVKFFSTDRRGNSLYQFVQSNLDGSTIEQLTLPDGIRQIVGFNVEAGCLTFINFQEKVLTCSQTGLQKVKILHCHWAGGVSIFNAETTDLYQIPVDNLGYLEGLSWSADGEKLFISAGKEIFLFDLDSELLEIVAQYPDRFNEFIPSPNKDMIMYEVDVRTRKTDLYLFDIAKKNNKKIYSQESILSQGKTLDSINWHCSSTWSPDGKYIAYFTTPEPEKYSRTDPRPVFLNIYSVKTGGAVSFEVPTTSGWWVFNSYWTYPTE
jgi:hypothetical protein